MLRRAVPGATALALVLAGCASQPKPAPAPPPVAPPVAAPTPSAAPAQPQFTATPGLTPRERVRKALGLLGDGEADQARAELQQLKVDQPDSELAQSLLDQIDRDPKQLLGEQSFAYVIRPGETLSVLADRYLGDRFLFYALARYNGISAPAKAEVGQTIQIPGTPRRITPPKRPRPPVSDAEAIDERLAGRRPAAPPKPAPPPPRPAGPVRDPGRANALRSTALVQMNNGAIDRAVALLRQAQALDPDNAAIGRDLQRAVRIQGAAGRR